MDISVALALLSLSAPITVAILKLVHRPDPQELHQLAVSVARLETKVENLQAAVVRLGELVRHR